MPFAFAAMMFAHAAFEREISALQDAITKRPGFGGERRNQWAVRERPGRFVRLIKAYQVDQFPQTGQVEKLLNEAVDPCEQRDLLAHGTWRCLQPSYINHCGARRNATGASGMAEKLKTIEAELYELRRTIEPPLSEAEIREQALAAIKAEINNLHRLIEPPLDGTETPEQAAKPMK